FVPSKKLTKSRKGCGRTQIIAGERRRRSVAPHADFVVVASDHHHDRGGGAASPLEPPRLGFGDPAETAGLSTIAFQKKNFSTKPHEEARRRNGPHQHRDFQLPS